MLPRLVLGVVLLAADVSSAQALTPPEAANVMSSEDGFQVLLQRANQALETQIPEPYDFDAQGRMNREHLSATFIAWVDANQMDRDKVLANLAVFSESFLYLAMTTDPRAIPVLRRALLVHRVAFQSMAAEGLSGMRDYDSIPLILRACREAPAEAASLIATFGLLPFGDPEVTQEAMQYLPTDVQKMIREGKIPVQPPFPKPAWAAHPTNSQ